VTLRRKIDGPDLQRHLDDFCRPDYVLEPEPAHALLEKYIRCKFANRGHWQCIDRHGRRKSDTQFSQQVLAGQ
jgi:hypothetical protein